MTFLVRYLPGRVVLALGCTVAVFWSAQCLAASGRILIFTSNPDLEAGAKGFGGFLRALGYTADVTPPGDLRYTTLDADSPEDRATKIAELEACDLVVIHRNFGSATLASTETEISIWNQLKVPILMCNAPIARSNRWRWVNANSGAAPASRFLGFDQPDHPIVKGLDLDLFKADRVYGGLIQGDDGGPFMQLIARAGVPGFDPICLAVWDECSGQARPFYDGSNQSYFRRRVFFEMHEYRNNPDAATVDAWTEITDNGNLIFANAVEYAMAGTVASKPPPQIVDVVPANGTENHLAGSGLSFRVTSAQPVPVSSIRLISSGKDVSDDLVFGGTATDRTVSCSGLEPNQVYEFVLIAGNTFGTRTASLTLNTFVAEDTVQLWTWDGKLFEGAVPANVYSVFVRCRPTSTQTGTLHFGTDAEQGLRGQLTFTAAGPDTETLLVAARDAFGAPVALRLSGDVSFVIAAPNVTGLQAAEIVLAPVSNPPTTLPPLLIQAGQAPEQMAVSPAAIIELMVMDRDTSVLADSVQLEVNGSSVTATSTVTDTTDGVVVRHAPPSFFVPGSHNTVRVTLQHMGFGCYPAQTAAQWKYGFDVRNIPALPADYASQPGSGLDPGFNVRNSMAPGAIGIVFTNTTARAEVQLAGQLKYANGEPVLNEINQTPFPTSFAEPNTINYGRDLSAAAGRFGDDALFPGGSPEIVPNNIALEATAHLELKAGLHRFGVRSDDGFRLTAGKTLEDQDIVLGGYEGIRGDQVPTEFEFLVYQDGVYAMRLVYYDGDGGASLEWYAIHEGTVSPDNLDGRVLVNSLDNNGLLRVPAFRNRASGPVVPQPTLAVGRDQNDLILTWISAHTFQLEFSAGLSAPDWQSVAATPVVVGDQHTVRLPLQGTAGFFRLRRRNIQTLISSSHASRHATARAWRDDSVFAGGHRENHIF